MNLLQTFLAEANVQARDIVQEALSRSRRADPGVTRGRHLRRPAA
jgi:dTDP-4-dehydrorhamnose 3,5-epimerase-like enzyme